MNDPARSCISRLDGHRLGESGVDEPAQRPVDEGLSNGEYLAHVSVGLQVLCYGEAVSRSFGKETEHDVFGLRQLY